MALFFSFLPFVCVLFVANNVECFANIQARVCFHPSSFPNYIFNLLFPSFLTAKLLYVSTYLITPFSQTIRRTVFLVVAAVAFLDTAHSRPLNDTGLTPGEDSDSLLQESPKESWVSEENTLEEPGHDEDNVGDVNIAEGHLARVERQTNNPCILKFVYRSIANYLIRGAICKKGCTPKATSFAIPNTNITVLVITDCYKN